MALNKAKLLVVLCFALSPLCAWAIDFTTLINNPAKFHNKRVTVVAMAQAGGDRFYLYQPPEPETPGLEHAVIYGALSREGPVYDQLNKKWVKVTGLVDAKYRGLASENACSVFIERVRPLGQVTSRKAMCTAACLEIDFPKLLKEPGTYEQKCVCVTGFAHVRGDAFVVYENEKAAEGPDFTRGIFISPQSQTANYDRFDKRWIKIKGSIDLTRRGYADYPCGMIAEDIRSASGKK